MFAFVLLLVLSGTLDGWQELLAYGNNIARYTLMLIYLLFCKTFLYQIARLFWRCWCEGMSSQTTSSDKATTWLWLRENKQNELCIYWDLKNKYIDKDYKTQILHLNGVKSAANLFQFRMDIQNCGYYYFANNVFSSLLTYILKINSRCVTNDSWVQECKLIYWLELDRV